MFADADVRIPAKAFEAHVPDELLRRDFNPENAVGRTGDVDLRDNSLEGDVLDLLDPGIHRKAGAGRANNTDEVAVRALSEIRGDEEQIAVSSSVRSGRSLENHGDLVLPDTDQLVSTAHPQGPGGDVRRECDPEKRDPFRVHDLIRHAAVLRCLTDRVGPIRIRIRVGQHSEIAYKRVAGNERPAIGGICDLHEDVPILANCEIFITQNDAIAAGEGGAAGAGCSGHGHLPFCHMEMCLSGGHGETCAPYFR